MAESKKEEEADPRTQLRNQDDAQPRIPAGGMRTSVTVTEPKVEQTWRVIELPDEAAGSSLRYEELVKRCTRAEWKLRSDHGNFWGMVTSGELGQKDFGRYGRGCIR